MHLQNILSNGLFLSIIGLLWRIGGEFSDDKIVTISLPVAALAILLKGIFDVLTFLKLKKNGNANGNGNIDKNIFKMTVSLNNIEKIMAEQNKTNLEVKELLHKLYELHNVRDNHGNFIWYSNNAEILKLLNEIRQCVK